MDAQGRVTPEEVRRALRGLYKEDREANLQKALLHVLRNDLKPVTERGRWRANPMLVLGGFLLLAAFVIFLCFSRSGAA